jgi:hypothetical protein
MCAVRLGRKLRWRFDVYDCDQLGLYGVRERLLQKRQHLRRVLPDRQLREPSRVHDLGERSLQRVRGRLCSKRQWQSVRGSCVWRRAVLAERRLPELHCRQWLRKCSKLQQLD